MRARAKNRWRFALTTSLVVVMACKGEARVPPAAGSAPEGQRLRIAVSSATAELGQLELAPRSIGIVDAWQSASLRAEAGGRVLELSVDNGDRVQADDTLLRLDSSRQSISVSGARANVQGLREDLAFAEREAERLRKLVARGSAATAALDSAEHNVVQVQSALASARANLRSAQRQLKDGRVVAPFAGIVTDRRVDLGDTLTPGAPLMDIVDLSRVRVRVGVAGSELSSLRVGAQAEVRIEDLGGVTLPAKVSSIAPAAHPVSGLFDVELHAPNPEQRVRAGMVASVAFERGSRPDRVLVPRSALTRRGGRTVVFVIDQGIARERPVVAGASDPEHIEIVEGLAAGAIVATSALHALAEGVAVEDLGDASTEAISARPSEGPKADASASPGSDLEDGAR